MKLKEFVKSKYFVFVAIVLFAAIPPLFYSQYLCNDLLLVSGDGAGYFSMRSFFNNELWSGTFPMWNKYLEGGLPYGAFDSVGLYPVALILSFFSPAVFSYLFYFVHLFIGAFFTYLFLGELKFSRTTALIVSLIYELSIHLNGYRKSHIMLIAGIVFLPVVLYFIQKYLNTMKLKWLICSAVAMGIQFTGSHSQITIYTDALAFVYLVVNLVYNYKVKGKFPVKRTIKHIVLWLATYVGTMFAQLYTTLLLFADMRSFGIEPYSFDSFKSYSIHAVKLLQMALPYIFGDNINQALGPAVSSEMDIELFLGLFVLICLIFCVSHLFRKFEVKFSVIIMVIVFVYSSLAHIPFVAEIVYRLPIFGSFRVPSRALFIFVFFAFVLLAYFIESVRQKEYMEKYISFQTKVAAFGMAGIALVCVCMLFMSDTEDAMKDGLIKFSKVFLAAALVLAVMLILSLCYKRFVRNGSHIKVFYGVFCCVLTAVTLVETYPFSINTISVSSTYFDAERAPIETEISDTNYKVLDAFDSIDGAHEGMIGLNSGTDKKIMGINSYLTFNNPRLYQLLSGNELIPLNYSGLFSGFPNMEEILRSKNDLISVLGVKYIIDSSGILANDPSYISDFGIDKVILQDEESKHFPGTEEFNIYCWNIEASDMPLKVEFDLETGGDLGLMYIDMVDGSGFDGYNKNVFYSSQNSHYTVYYNVPSEIQHGSCMLRLVFKNTADAILKNFTVYQNDELNVMDTVFSADQVKLAACAADSYSLSSFDVAIEPDTYYSLSFDAYSDSAPALLYSDLYGEGYDAPEQQADITLTPGQSTSLTYVINSGSCPDSTQLRFVSVCDSDVVFNNISLEKVNKPSTGAYTPYYSDSAQSIYLNENAKDILFTNARVAPKDDNERIYRCVEQYDLLNTSYVSGFDKELDLTDGNTVISDIDFKTNSISAKIVSEKATFVNFSQCYYKGWSAYVDGEKVPVYVVDDVIMGAEVPAGQHTIEFRYSIPFFGAAVGLSCGVVVFWIVYFIISERKVKKD